MQISSLSEDQQVELALEASKLTAYLEAACTLEGPVEDESEESWTILPGKSGRKVKLTTQNPQAKSNYYDCLDKTSLD
jgi:hypothetical protein